METKRGQSPTEKKKREALDFNNPNRKTFQESESCMGGRVGFPWEWQGLLERNPTLGKLGCAKAGEGEWAALRRQPAVGTAKLNA